MAVTVGAILVTVGVAAIMVWVMAVTVGAILASVGVAAIMVWVMAVTVGVAAIILLITQDILITDTGVLFTGQEYTGEADLPFPAVLLSEAQVFTHIRMPNLLVVLPARFLVKEFLSTPKAVMVS